MKGIKRTKAFAMATAAAMMLSVTSAVPAITASAMGAKTVDVTLPTYEETLYFSDIPQADYKTTSITLTPNFSMTLDENSLVSAESGQFVQVSDDLYFKMDFNDSTVKSNIVSAIEAATGSSFSVDSADNAPVNVTGYSINYSWTYTTTDETLDVGIGCWSNGYEGDTQCFTNTYHECAEKTGSGSINSTAGENSSSINKYDGLWLNAGVNKSSESDCSGESLTFTIDSVALNVSYSLTGNGGYKSLGDDGWKFDLYMDDQGTVSPELIKAIQTANGDTPCQWPITVNDISVNYEWAFSTSNTDPTSDLSISSCGNISADNWADASTGDDPFTLEGTSGTGSVSARSFASSKGVSLAEILGMSMDIGAYTETTTDTLTLKLTSITVNVTYTPDTTMALTYEELQGAEYLDIDFNIAKKTECSHSADNVDHIGDDQQSYYESWTYCPWAAVEIYRASSDGTRLSSSYSVWPNLMDASPNYNRVNVSDIYAVTDALAPGEKLVFSGGADAEVTNIDILTSVPDIRLGTGSITSAVIEEQNDWDAVLGSVPNGKPDKKPTIQIAENFHAKSFKNYSAVKIDYTLDDPDECSGIIVILHGWEESGVGWAEKFYPVSGTSGSIVIDLSDVQDVTYNNIYVGPTAKPSAQIGDSFAPGFTITSAAMLGSYSGSYSSEIEDPTVFTDPVQAVEESRPGSVVEVEVSDSNTAINYSIFDAAKEKGLTLELTLSNGVTWTIEPDTITSDAETVDIGVELDTHNIPENKVAEVADGNDTMQISLSHNGDFGFSASVRIPISDEDLRNCYGHLYHYNNGSLEYKGSAPVKESSVTLPFTHASEYVIVFSSTPADPVSPPPSNTDPGNTDPGNTAPSYDPVYSTPPYPFYHTGDREDVSAGAGLCEDEEPAESSSSAIAAVCASLAALSAAAAVIAARRKARQK